MAQPSKTIPAVALTIGAVILIIGLALSFFPFNKEGSPAPTAAYRAQANLDEVAFGLGSSPGARYTGTLSFNYDGRDVSIDFEDLTVTRARGLQGQISVGGKQAEFLQFGFSQYVNGSTAFWQELLTTNQLENLDLEPIDGSWTEPVGTPLVALNAVLSPPLLAGRIAYAEDDEAPAEGAQLSTPNKGLPDARHYVMSDPEITENAPGDVSVSEWTIRYDPESSQINHVSGSYQEYDGTYELDTSIELIDDGQAAEVFTDARAIADDAATAPMAGVLLEQPTLRGRSVGQCLTTNCRIEVPLSGATTNTFFFAGETGRINYGIDMEFVRADRRSERIGVPCNDLVVGVAFDERAVARCTTRDLPEGVDFIPIINYQFLPVREADESDITDTIDEFEEATSLDFPMVRTGRKSPEAAAYTSQYTNMPSSFAVQVGDYVFDGVFSSGSLLVTLAPGYAEHIRRGEFDSDWEGTEVLRTQIEAQSTAAGGREIIYWVAEEETKVALESLISDAGYDSDEIRVLQGDLR